MRALLVIDMLNDFVAPAGKLYCGKPARKIIPFIKEKIDEFRKNKDLVIYICDNHDKDDVEFGLFPRHCVTGTKGAKVIDELKAKKGDFLVSKKTYDGFHGSDLEPTLKKNRIKEVFLAGVCTSICVMETAGSLAKRGYRITVFKDGVADFDQGAHKFALRRMKMIYGAEIA